MDQAPEPTQASTTPPPAPAPSAPAKSSSSYGTILGIILIVVILVVGAFYVWGQRLAEDQMQIPEDTAAEGSAEVNVDVPQPN